MFHRIAFSEGHIPIITSVTNKKEISYIIEKPYKHPTLNLFPGRNILEAYGCLVSL